MSPSPTLTDRSSGTSPVARRPVVGITTDVAEAAPTARAQLYLTYAHAVAAAREEETA